MPQLVLLSLVFGSIVLFIIHLMGPPLTGNRCGAELDPGVGRGPVCVQSDQMKLWGRESRRFWAQRFCLVVSLRKHLRVFALVLNDFHTRTVCLLQTETASLTHFWWSGFPTVHWTAAGHRSTSCVHVQTPDTWTENTAERSSAATNSWATIWLPKAKQQRLNEAAEQEVSKSLHHRPQTPPRRGRKPKEFQFTVMSNKQTRVGSLIWAQVPPLCHSYVTQPVAAGT